MADPVAPVDMPAGSTGTIPVRVNSDGTLDVLGADGNTISTVDPSDGVHVTPVALAVAVGDVLMLQANGDTRVVRWVADDGQHWASGQSTRPQFTTDGWVKVGTATLT